MKKTELVDWLSRVKDEKQQWAHAIRKYTSDVDALMSRLLHEAAANMMSDREVAELTGFSPKRVRDLMRAAGLNPRDGKTLLSQKAAEALANNAALMGIEPSEMDLMSPLAYLPMGAQMKRDLQERDVSQVHEVSGNHGSALDLAMKLADAGPEEADAIEWVNEVIARGEMIR